MEEDEGASDKDIKGSSDNTEQAQSLVLPPHWFLKQSRSRQGRIYYANAVLKTTTWDLPSFVPCPACCDDCQAFQVNLKTATKKKGEPQIKNFDHSVSVDACKMASPKEFSSTKSSTESVTEKWNLKLSKKLKKAALFTSKSCNASKKYSKKKISKLLAKPVSEPAEDSNDVSHKTKRKVLKAKRSDIKLNDLTSHSLMWSPSSDSKTSEEDSLHKKQSGNTISSTFLENKKKEHLSKIHQKSCSLGCNASSTADLICHLPSKVKFASTSPSTPDADSPRAVYGRDLSKVSFAIASPKKLSAAVKRRNSSDDDFTDKMNKFKKSWPLQDLSSSQEQLKFIQQPHRKKPLLFDKNTADKAAPVSKNGTGQCSEVSKEHDVSAVLLSSVSDGGLTEDKILPKLEFTTKNSDLKNLNTFLSSNVKLSENGCNTSVSLSSTDTSIISQISIPSDMGMEVDVATELQTIRRANGDHTIDNVDIRPPSQLDIQNSNSIDTGYVYAVVDTNVLISRLQLLNSISLARTASYKAQAIVLVIPYTALQELDSLKSRESLSQRARAAIRWCHECFKKCDATAAVRAQSFANYRLVRETLHGVNGDDHIRDCCLYLQQQGYSTVLLSDDINLRNKALVSDVTALDSATLAKDISYSASNKLSSTPCLSTSMPSLAAVSSGRCSTPATTSARTRHQTFVVRSNKETSIDPSESFSRCEEEVSNQSINDVSTCLDNNTSLSNNERIATSINLNNVDDPMEGLSSPSIIRSNNNSLNSSCVGTFPMSLSSSSVGDESRTSSVRSPRPPKLAKCTCKCSQDNEQSKEMSVLKSLETSLGNILKFVMVKEYGDLWIQIVKHKPPWTLPKIFDCWKKHWMAVFMDKFPRSFESQLKSLEKLTSSRRASTESGELERNALRLYNQLNHAPYKDLVQLPEKIVRDQSCEKSCSLCASENDSSTHNNHSIPLPDNENLVSLCDISRTSTFPPVQCPQKVETVQAAKDLIIITGNRMGQFVMEGVSFLLAGTPQPALLGPLSALWNCIDSLAASFVRCQQSRDAVSADELSEAVLQFWRNAKEGEAQQQRFVSSEAGRAAVRAFVQSDADSDFTAHCLQELQKMRTLLNTELSRATQIQTL